MSHAERVLNAEELIEESKHLMTAFQEMGDNFTHAECIHKIANNRNYVVSSLNLNEALNKIDLLKS